MKKLLYKTSSNILCKNGRVIRDYKVVSTDVDPGGLRKLVKSGKSLSDRKAVKTAINSVSTGSEYGVSDSETVIQLAELNAEVANAKMDEIQSVQQTLSAWTIGMLPEEGAPSECTMITSDGDTVNAAQNEDDVVTDQIIGYNGVTLDETNPKYYDYVINRTTNVDEEALKVAISGDQASIHAMPYNINLSWFDADWPDEEIDISTYVNEIISNFYLGDVMFDPRKILKVKTSEMFASQIQSSITFTVSLYPFENTYVKDGISHLLLMVVPVLHLSGDTTSYLPSWLRDIPEVEGFLDKLPIIPLAYVDTAAVATATTAVHNLIDDISSFSINVNDFMPQAQARSFKLADVIADLQNQYNTNLVLSKVYNLIQTGKTSLDTFEATMRNIGDKVLGGPVGHLVELMRNSVVQNNGAESSIQATALVDTLESAVALEPNPETGKVTWPSSSRTVSTAVGGVILNIVCGVVQAVGTIMLLVGGPVVKLIGLLLSGAAMLVKVVSDATATLAGAVPEINNGAMDNIFSNEFYSSDAFNISLREYSQDERYIYAPIMDMFERGNSICKLITRSAIIYFYNYDYDTGLCSVIAYPKMVYGSPNRATYDESFSSHRIATSTMTTRQDGGFVTNFSPIYSEMIYHGDEGGFIFNYPYVPNAATITSESININTPVLSAHSHDINNINANNRLQYVRQWFDMSNRESGANAILDQSYGLLGVHAWIKANDPKAYRFTKLKVVQEEPVGQALINSLQDIVWWTIGAPGPGAISDPLSSAYTSFNSTMQLKNIYPSTAPMPFSGLSLFIRCITETPDYNTWWSKVCGTNDDQDNSALRRFGKWLDVTGAVPCAGVHANFQGTHFERYLQNIMLLAGASAGAAADYYTRTGLDKSRYTDVDTNELISVSAVRGIDGIAYVTPPNISKQALIQALVALGAVTVIATVAAIVVSIKVKHWKTARATAMYQELNAMANPDDPTSPSGTRNMRPDEVKAYCKKVRKYNFWSRIFNLGQFDAVNQWYDSPADLAGEASSSLIDKTLGAYDEITTRANAASTPIDETPEEEVISIRDVYKVISPIKVS